MRILHTSDWHLGHTLHEFSREIEHRRFLAWLLDTLDEHQIDALLIAGDIFETANPSAVAQEIWYGFLADARRRRPKLDIVVVGGNHDSAARLDAPRPILAGHDVFMVGGLPRKADGELELDRLLAPLHDADGEVKAWVTAVPYLRITDLPRISDVEDPLIEGVRHVYAEVIAAARQRCDPDHALVATGHCYMTDSQISEMSERRILGGNQHALPVDIFPPDIAYVALGHLHLPQGVASDHVRYSGSPIPLSLGEREYPHQVLLVELEGADLASVTPLIIPRAVDLLRVPEREALPLGEILPLLEALPDGNDDPQGEWPFLEVHVSLPAPEPTLRADVEKALEGRRVRLVRLQPTYTGTGAALGDHTGSRRLDELQVEEVFLKCWHMKYEEKPDAELLEAFHELVERTHQEGA
ncbi:MAG: exonuclease subunit SbcD [bacterium]|nr:exonuclease subunit SbcD [bacterium]